MLPFHNQTIWSNYTELIGQSGDFIGQIENGATFGETAFVNWNPVFVDFQLLFFVFLLIAIWSRYFYKVIYCLFFQKK